jgi:hypothetical protein
VLANLVERLLPEATRVTIVVPAQPGAFRLAPGVYPPASDDLPFPVSDESQDRNLEVRIDFLHPLAPDQRTQIEEALSDWWYASSLGAFREADQPASESSALPPESVEWEECALSFTLEKLRSSPAIVSALVGIVAWADRAVAPVASLDIG